MTIPGSPALRRRRLAAELRAIRERNGKSGDAVAAALHWSPSKVSRYELARTGLKLAEVAKLLDYYQVTGDERKLLLDLARDAAGKGWWEQFGDCLSEDYQRFIGLEHEASSITIWHVGAVPGLFQTEAYARRIISSYSHVEPTPPGIVERLVRVRMRRQELLSREPPVSLSVVLDESVLRRRIGSNQIMREQMYRLANDAGRPHVTLRILPLDTDHAVPVEAFVIFSFATGEATDFPDVVSSEHLKNVFSVEGERDTYLHQLVFHLLRTAALDPDASRELILQTAEHCWPESDGDR